MIKRILAWLRALLEDKPPPAVTPAPVPVPQPEPPQPSATGDALSLASVIWLGTPVAAGVPITAKITAASTDGGTLTTAYEPYSWPVKTVKIEVDAICHLFYEQQGRVVGGKFDWWRKSGQSKKGLENVHSGYGGHIMPAKGTKAWAMISSVDGKQRSNTCSVEWR